MQSKIIGIFTVFALFSACGSAPPPPNTSIKSSLEQDSGDVVREGSEVESEGGRTSGKKGNPTGDGPDDVQEDEAVADDAVSDDPGVTPEPGNPLDPTADPTSTPVPEATPTPEPQATPTPDPVPKNALRFQNPTNRFDVNGDGAVSPIDSLLISSYVNKNGAGPIPSIDPDGVYYDVNGDSQITLDDAQDVIDQLSNNK